MRGFHFIIAVICLLMVQGAGIAVAQEDAKDGGMALAPPSSTSSPFDDLSYLFQPQYNQQVRMAVVTWPKPYDFRYLRMLYAKTRQYDPLGEETLQKLAALSYAVENASNAKEKELKAGEFQDLVLEHLAHVSVILQALSLSRDNKIYGDPAFYEWVLQGLENRIVNVYNGRSMKNAIILITLADETLLFNRLGVKSVYSEMVSNGSKFYYIHLVEDRKTQKQYELFTDASIPLRVLKIRHNQQSKPLSLRQ